MTQNFHPCADTIAHLALLATPALPALGVLLVYALDRQPVRWRMNEAAP